MSKQRAQDNALAEKSTDTKPCPVCGETIKATAKKCIHCNEFIEKIPEKSTDTKPCPVCKEPIKLKARKCIHCGEFIEKYKPTSQSDWKKITKWDLVKIVPLILIGVVIWVYRQELTYSWMAGAGLVVLLLILLIFEKYVRSRAPKVTAIGGDATIWDLGKVLLVPIVLALLGFILSDLQEQRQTEIEDRRIEAQSKVEAGRSNESALQSYFDGMAELLLEKELRNSNPRDEVRSIARTRTLTVLRRLDPERKGALLLFLHEAELIKPPEVIDLFFADLRGANLIEADLTGADLADAKLEEANLFGGNLEGAFLQKADLRWANLSEAKLRKADLSEVNLSRAKLVKANLIEAKLRKANLREANLREANLTQAILEEANLSGANLSGANLIEANLIGTDLRWADLREANLRRAVLAKANLREADLREAKIDDSTLIDDKWRLVWEIVNQGAAGQDLRGADLSGANLRGANLRGANLRGANLSGTNLCATNLSGTDLSGANLDGARYNIEPLEDEFGITYQPTQWPADFDPAEHGAIDVS